MSFLSLRECQAVPSPVHRMRDRPAPCIEDLQQRKELNNGHLDRRRNRNRARSRAVGSVCLCLHPSREGTRTHLVHLVETAGPLGHRPGRGWTSTDSTWRRRCAGLVTDWAMAARLRPSLRQIQRTRYFRRFPSTSRKTISPALSWRTPASIFERSPTSSNVATAGAAYFAAAALTAARTPRAGFRAHAEARSSAARGPTARPLGPPLG